MKKTTYEGLACLWRLARKQAGVDYNMTKILIRTCMLSGLKNHDTDFKETRVTKKWERFLKGESEMSLKSCIKLCPNLCLHQAQDHVAEDKRPMWDLCGSKDKVDFLSPAKVITCLNQQMEYSQEYKTIQNLYNVTWTKPSIKLI